MGLLALDQDRAPRLVLYCLPVGAQIIVACSSSSIRDSQRNGWETTEDCRKTGERLAVQGSGSDVNDPERRQPPTLAEVRTAVAESGTQWPAEGELLHPQDLTSLIIEVDELIKDYGAGFCVTEFVDAS